MRCGLCGGHINSDQEMIRIAMGLRAGLMPMKREVKEGYHVDCLVNLDGFSEEEFHNGEALRWLAEQISENLAGDSRTTLGDTSE